MLAKLDEFWDEYKVHSGKVSLGISIVGGIGAILAGNSIIAGSIVIGVTNVAIFFSSIAYEKLVNDLNNTKKDNESLKNEKNEMIRRFTEYQFPEENDRFNRKIVKMEDIKDFLETTSIYSSCPTETDIKK